MKSGRTSLSIILVNNLSFNFNKKKEIGIKEIRVGNKLLIEAIV